MPENTILQTSRLNSPTGFLPSHGGALFVKSISGVCSFTRFLTSSGITADSARDEAEYLNSASKSCVSNPALSPYSLVLTVNWTVLTQEGKESYVWPRCPVLKYCAAVFASSLLDSFCPFPASHRPARVQKWIQSTTDQ